MKNYIFLYVVSFLCVKCCLSSLKNDCVGLKFQVTNILIEVGEKSLTTIIHHSSLFRANGGYICASVFLLIACCKSNEKNSGETFCHEWSHSCLLCSFLKPFFGGKLHKLLFLTETSLNPFTLENGVAFG